MGMAVLAHSRLAVPLWLVIPFCLAILAWWTLFLLIVPATYKSNHPI